MFFAQRLGPDDFVNGGPRKFPMAELKGLIDDVRQNNPLDSVTITGRWYFNNEGIFGYNKNGTITHGLGSKATGQRSQQIQDNLGEDLGAQSPPPKGPDPCTTTSGVILQNFLSGGRQGQGSGCQSLTPDPLHPTFHYIMNRFLHSFVGLYLMKVL